MRTRFSWMLVAFGLPVAAALAGAVLLFLLVSLLWFPRRPMGTPSEDDLQWHGGRIVAQDFSSFPGGYDMEVWWLGDKGNEIRLVDLGDNTRFDYWLEDDRLCVRYLMEKDRWSLAVFEAPDAQARLTDTPSPFDSGDFREWRFRVEDGKVQRSDLKTSR